MKKKYLCALLLIFSQVLAVANAADWRKTGSDRQKIDNMVKVVPGASNIMLQMGERYKNIYWAGKQEKWQEKNQLSYGQIQDRKFSLLKYVKFSLLR